MFVLKQPIHTARGFTQDHDLTENRPLDQLIAREFGFVKPTSRPLRPFA